MRVLLFCAHSKAENRRLQLYGRSVVVKAALKGKSEVQPRHLSDEMLPIPFVCRASFSFSSSIRPLTFLLEPDNCFCRHVPPHTRNAVQFQNRETKVHRYRKGPAMIPSRYNRCQPVHTRRQSTEPVTLSTPSWHSLPLAKVSSLTLPRVSSQRMVYMLGSIITGASSLMAEQ